MNKAEQESVRKAIHRCYYRENNRWAFNGRAFEMRMCMIRSHTAIHANFESKVNEVSVWVTLYKLYQGQLEIESPRKKFLGDNCMIDAINWLSDCVTDTLEDIRKTEQEIVDSQQLTADIMRERLAGIFERIPAFA